MRVRRMVASVTTAVMVAGGVSLAVAPATSAAPNCSAPAAPGVDWSGCDKSGVDLSFASLAGADLSGVNLTDANVFRADLSGANLTGAFVACGTGGDLGTGGGMGGIAYSNSVPAAGVPPILPAGWTIVDGVLTVPVVACASVAFEVSAPVSVGAPVTLRATLTPATAAGSVEFLTDEIFPLGAAPVAGGVATLVWTPTVPGKVTLVAQYTATNRPPGGVASALTTKAVTVAASVPGAPTGVRAAAGDAQARVSWTAPGSNGGSAVTAYVVQQSFDAGASWTSAAGSPATGSTTSLLVRSLANGVRVSFRVAAVNTAGTGPFSTPSSAVIPTAGAVTPPAPPTTTPTTTDPTTSVAKPGKVAGLKGKSTGKRKVTLRWKAPRSGSPALNYQYRAKGITKWKTTTRTKATVKSKKLNKVKKIRVQVRAQNTAGNGPVASKRIKITR